MSNKDLAKAIGERLREIRAEKEMSQDDFGGLVGSDRTYICKIESGTKNLTLWKLCQICESSGISLQQFFSETTFAKFFNNQEDK